MIDEPKIELCPECKDESNIPFVYYYNQVTCPRCYRQGPRRGTAAEAIRAWNQMALAFEIARADAIMECSGEVHIYNELSLANETAAHNAACDAHTIYRRSMDEWRQTDG